MTPADIARMSWHQRAQYRRAWLARIDATPPRVREATRTERDAIRGCVQAIHAALVEADRAKRTTTRAARGVVA